MAPSIRRFARWLVSLVTVAALAAGPLPPLAAQTTAPRAASQAAASQKFLVNNGAVAALDALSASGAQRLADYGAFSLWRVAAGPATALAQRDGVSYRPDFDTIPLRGLVIDTRAGAARPTLPAALTQARSVGPKFWLVQFAGPIHDDWLKHLASLGLQTVSYLPHNAYVVWGDAAGLARLDAWAAKDPVVQWTGAYHAAFRLEPSLQATAFSAPPAAFVDVTVQFYTTAGVDAALARLLALGGPVRKSPEQILSFTNVTLPLPAGRLVEVANWPDVFNVEPWSAPERMDEIQNQIIAGNIISTSGNVVASGPGYLGWLVSKGFTTTAAAYPIVDVVDDGIDDGSTSPLHPDFHVLGVLTGTSRLVYNTNCTADAAADGEGGHGNLNAGIVGAYNNVSGSPHVDADGYRLGLGVSPYGQLGGTKIFNNAGAFDISACGGTDTGVVLASYSAGAQMTSNSWGANVGGAYNSSAQAYDALTRDAALVPAGNQEMLHIFSAGNAGALGANTIGSPGTAKNVLTVGATENPRDNGVLDRCGFSDADDADDIATFSSRGPTDDLRVKPDLMAPGVHIQGPASQDLGYTGNSVCGNPSAPIGYYPPGQTLYTWSSGTSHSAPGVAGAASLTYEYYGRVLNPGQVPSPAMLKALLLNTPRYLNGTGTGGTLPNNDQGWGDVNLGALFYGTPRALLDQSVVLTSTGSVYTLTGQVVTTTVPFNVSLVWTDAPGSTTGNAYVNDLNLQVTVGGTTYNGNVFSGAHSVSGGTSDPRNNVENVFLPAGVTGDFQVEVIAANIAGDGVPGNGDATDQDFALVIFNGSTTLVAFSGNAYSAGEGQPSTTLTATLRAASVQTITVNYATSSGSASPGSDYVSASGTLTFTPGASTATLPISLLDDALVEGSETLTVTLTGPVNASLGSPNPATLTLLDDDAAGAALGPPTASLTGNSGEGLTYTLTLTNTGSVTDTFDLAFAGGAFTATVPTAMGPLAPGTSTAFDVAVHIPPGAAPGAQSASTLTVTSQADPGVSASATLTTHVWAYRVSIPLIRR